MRINFRKTSLSKAQQEERKQRLVEIGSKVYDIFIEDSAKYGFEVREGQQDMACEIVEAILAGKHFAVEAGVGIGKSYAYLVPSLLYSQAFNIPVVVATSTIALQEQLLNDVKHLQKILHTDRDVILAKGQTHYVCRKKADQYIADPTLPLCKEIRTGIALGAQERKDFNCIIPQKLWDKINISRFSMRACFSCGRKCLYYHIRDQLQYANGIILCNQDFLTAHLRQQRQTQNGLLPETVDVIIVDEAHNLEDKVRNAATGYLSEQNLLTMINAAVRDIPPSERSYVQNLAEQTETAIHAFYRRLQDQVKCQINESAQDMRYADRFFFQRDKTSVALLAEMSNRLNSLSKNIEIQLSRIKKAASNTSASDELDSTAFELFEVLDSWDDYLIWLERKGPNVEFVFCPKDTKKMIHNLFFTNNILSILTSATLTTAGKGTLPERYSYFIDSTGFPVGEKAILSEPKPSPFPYNEHAMIYYCDDLPHPTKDHEDFIIKGSERLIEILNISHGKALVLFTAKADMEEVYRMLQSQNLPYKILMQQAGSSQESILKEFADDIDSVLLGTGAYWEGISIEGRSLSNLIIFRLPFPVPDPIISYKASISDDPLMKVMVPEMVMKLKQGIGRLIRNYTDTGIISIIDPRLKDDSPKPYRNIVWDALPIQNRTNCLQTLKTFYSKLPGYNLDT